MKTSEKTRTATRERATTKLSKAELEAAEQELFGAADDTFSSDPDYGSASMNWKSLLDPRMKNPNVAGATPNHLPQQMNKLDAMVHVLAQRVTRLEMAMGQVISQKGITVRV